ncbi:MAG: peptide-N-glycosidase F-related protein [Kofleriaceae bacterium]
MKRSSGALVLASLVATGCGDNNTSDNVDSGTVFANAYAVTLFDNTRINSKPDQPNYQRIYAPLDLHDGPFGDVKLTFDLATTCFPFESWQTNPPPEDERWPADCDAFDRLYQITVDPARSEGQDPGFEIMRAATPFGGPSHVELDITDLANALPPGTHQIEVYISTFSDTTGQVTGSNGGFNITGKLHATPGTPPRKVLAAIPMVLRTDTMNGQPAIPFTFPAGTTRGAIEYRATGHGGGAGDADCIGPAEEFCARDHTLFVDDQQVEAFQPWIPSCAHMCDTSATSYCAQNPTGLQSSVRAPRANWCPGAVTAPKLISGAWGPGEHSFRYDINKIEPLKGKWAISATAYAYAD